MWSKNNSCVSSIFKVALVHEFEDLCASVKECGLYIPTYWCFVLSLQFRAMCDGLPQ
jgi:hypothetical protein